MYGIKEYITKELYIYSLIPYIPFEVWDSLYVCKTDPLFFLWAKIEASRVPSASLKRGDPQIA